eukprot:1400819-Amphidinium_carterae.2
MAPLDHFEISVLGTVTVTNLPRALSGRQQFLTHSHRRINSEGGKHKNLNAVERAEVRAELLWTPAVVTFSLSANAKKVIAVGRAPLNDVVIHVVIPHEAILQRWRPPRSRWWKSSTCQATVSTSSTALANSRQGCRKRSLRPSATGLRYGCRTKNTCSTERQSPLVCDMTSNHKNGATRWSCARASLMSVSPAL